METSFFKQILQSTIFLFLFLNKVSSYSSRQLRVLLEYYMTRRYLTIKSIRSDAIRYEAIQ
jgi:hypothetical protein